MYESALYSSLGHIERKDGKILSFPVQYHKTKLFLGQICLINIDDSFTENQTERQRQIVSFGVAVAWRFFVSISYEFWLFYKNEGKYFP